MYVYAQVYACVYSCVYIHPISLLIYRTLANTTYKGGSRGSTQQSCPLTFPHNGAHEPTHTACTPILLISKNHKQIQTGSKREN